MRRLVALLLLAVVIVIGLGFYLNWFNFAQKSGDDQTTISVTIDKEKIQSDVGQAKNKIKDMAELAKENAKSDGSASKNQNQ